MRAIKVVRAEGNPAERGRAIGRGFRDEIRDRAAFYLDHFARRGFDRRVLEEQVAPFLAAAESILPTGVEMLRGMADGAGVSFADLVVPNVFEELDPLLRRATDGTSAGPRNERCSTVSVVAHGVTLLGHNEMWLAADADAFGVVIEIPSERGAVATVSPTTVCYLPAVGMNAAGGAQGVMSLTASDDGVGVPRTLVARHALEAKSRADAIARCGIGGRSGGYAYACARAGGEAFAVETSGTRMAVIDGPGFHTNHYLDRELAAIGGEPSAGSLARLDRLAELVAERDPVTPTELMEVLSDHRSSPQAICTHPDDTQGEDAEAVVFSMVCDLEARRMWVAPGNPCEGFEEVDLEGVL